MMRTGLLLLLGFFPFWAFAGGGEICNNGIDDDGDNLVDCADPDCQTEGIFPIIEDFDGGVLSNPNWVLTGSASLNTDWLRLTDDIGGQAGNAILNSAFSSASDIIVEFDYATVDYNGNNCTFGIGDGLAFFLINGTAGPSIGVSGAALGYSHGRTGDPARGIDGGFIAVGLDEFGNFAGGNAAPSTCTQLGDDVITIRGEETAFDATAYRCISTTLLPGNADVDVPSRAQARRVRITLSPGGVFDLYMDLNDGSGLQPIFENLNTGQSVPPTFKLGFSASTGGACIAHEIDNLTVGKPADVTVDISGPDEVSACAGTIKYTVTAVNHGPNNADGIFLNADFTGPVEATDWICDGCVESSGSGGSSLSIGADIAVGDTATWTITVTLADGAAGSSVNLTAAVDFACTGLISSNIDNSTASASTLVTEESVSVALGSDTTVCDNPLLLDATTDGAAYLWSDGSTDATLLVEQSGEYWVEVTRGTCTDRDTIAVTLRQTPGIGIVGDLSFCEGEFTVLTAVLPNPPADILWGDGSSEETLEVSESGSVSVTASNECGSSTETVEVEEIACDCDYFFPNAFSPNDDGNNDVYAITTSASIASSRIEIFDRWGERVFEGESGFAWDGTFRGRRLPTDAYYYVAELQCSVTGEKIIVKGNITLIR